jgi:hypothetical protein
MFLSTVFGKERAHAVRSTPAWPGLISTANTLPREMETAGSVGTTMLVGSDSPTYMKEGTEVICSSAPALFAAKVLEATR